MVIKDRVYTWFIRNVVIPKTEIIDESGFIISRFSPSKEIALREIFIGENFIQNLENKAKFHEQILYSIGKNFGYNYAYISGLPTIKKVPKNNFLSFANLMVRYIETLYASSLKHNITLETKTFTLKMQNYIVCSKNGLGYIFSEGGITGIWSYACQDPTIEAVQPKCQGRGDKECEVIAAPYETLVKMGYKPIRCTKLEKSQLTQEYKKLNEIKATKWATKSLKTLIDSGFFKYSHGQVTYKGERFFLCEASFMYILEKELKKVRNGLKILWDCSFDFGKRLAQLTGKQDHCKFVMDFFPALGFGDILAIEKGGRYEIIVRCFPWHQWAKEIDFTMFRGMLSGVISGFSDRKVELKKIKKDTREGNLSLYITES